MDERMQDNNPLGALLSNPKLLGTLAGVLGGGSSHPQENNGAEKSPANTLSEGIGSVLSNPDLMAKLPAVMEMLKPMLSGTAPAPTERVDATDAEAPKKEASIGTEALPAGAFSSFDNKGSPRDRSRNDLLLALKPFLSRERCEAVDMILRLSALGAVLNRLR